MRTVRFNFDEADLITLTIAAETAAAQIGEHRNHAGETLAYLSTWALESYPHVEIGIYIPKDEHGNFEIGAGYFDKDGGRQSYFIMGIMDRRTGKFSTHS